MDWRFFDFFKQNQFRIYAYYCQLNASSIKGLEYQRIICKTQKATSDENGAAWFPIDPNFLSDDNIRIIFSFPDTWSYDRIILDHADYNGFAVFAYKDGEVLKNSDIWLTYIAIGPA